MTIEPRTRVRVIVPAAQIAFLSGSDSSIRKLQDALRRSDGELAELRGELAAAKGESAAARTQAAVSAKGMG